MVSAAILIRRAAAEAAATVVATSTSASAPLPLVTTHPNPVTPPLIDSPDVDNDNCRLLGPFALVVQALMGIFVVGSLVWKRQREQPRRPWKIWLLDITKQMIGQLFVHTLNVLLSNIVANAGEDNPCALYFLNILIDTTFGVFIIYLTLRICTHILTDVWGLRGFVSGQYTDKRKRGRGKASRPKVAYWFKQLALYFFALFVMKVVVTLLFVLFPFLADFAGWTLGLFGEAKNVQVLFSMCIFPLVMNVFQFWLVDTLLRHNPHKSKYATAADREGTAEAESGPGDSATNPTWGLSHSSRPSRMVSAADDEEQQQSTYLVGDDSDEDDEDGGLTKRRSSSAGLGQQSSKDAELLEAEEGERATSNPDPVLRVVPPTPPTNPVNSTSTNTRPGSRSSGRSSPHSPNQEGHVYPPVNSSSNSPASSSRRSSPRPPSGDGRGVE